MGRLIGVVADFGQQYGTPVNSSIGSSSLVVHEHQTTVLFGPQISIPVRRVRAFAHALFGLDHFSDHAVSSAPATVTISGNHFATALGGGIDFKLSRRIWIRLVQMDWVRVSRRGGGFNEIRSSAGVVIHLWK
ncbi:MAG: hypothetical protein ACM3NO_06750 [Deltaproteobacteria bacterium]